MPVKLELPYEEIFRYYEGNEPTKYDLLTGMNMNRPLDQLLEDIKFLRKELEELKSKVEPE